MSCSVAAFRHRVMGKESLAVGSWALSTSPCNLSSWNWHHCPNTTQHRCNATRHATQATWCDNIMIPHPSACFASTGWTETWDVVSCSCALHLPWMQALALLETMAKKAWWVLGEVFPSKLLIATLWSTSFISFPLKFTTFFVDFWSKTARSFAVTWCAAAAPLVASVVNVDGNTLCSSCSKCSSLAATGDLSIFSHLSQLFHLICFSVSLLLLKKLYSTILLPELLLLPFEFEGVFSQANTPNGLRMSQTTFGRDKLQRTR